MGLGGDLKQEALVVEGYQRQEEDQGVEEVVVVVEEDLQKPSVEPEEPEELEELEEQGLKRNNQLIHLFIYRDRTFPE